VSFRLHFTAEARANLKALEEEPGLQKRLKAVRKTLGLLETNLRHPGLRTHEFHSLKGATGEKVFEAYAESRTPGAYRVFWHHGPGKGELTIIAITPHP
jgi:hypothetical protein